MPKRSRMSRALVRRETTAGYLFLLPSLFFFITFVVVPMFICIYTSFFDSNMGRDTEDVYIGFSNYVELFQDEIFLGALKNTLIIVVVSVPVTCIFSLWVATIISRMPVAATSAFRCIFYLPVVTGSVAVTARGHAQELHAFAAHLEPRALLAGLVVGPLVHLDAAFHEDGRTLPQVLAARFRLTVPDFHVQIHDAFDALVVAAPQKAVRNRDPQHRNRGSRRRQPAQFRVAGQVAHEIDPIEARTHWGCSSAGASGTGAGAFWPDALTTWMRKTFSLSFRRASRAGILSPSSSKARNP